MQWSGIYVAAPGRPLAQLCLRSHMQNRPAKSARYLRIIISFSSGWGFYNRRTREPEPPESDIPQLGAQLSVAPARLVVL